MAPVRSPWSKPFAKRSPDDKKETLASFHMGFTPSNDQWSQFLNDLNLTDEADTLASTFDKIYVLSTHNMQEDILHSLYYIDLSAASKDSDNTMQSLRPILQYLGLYGDVVYNEHVIVGSKLYMLGGHDSIKNVSSEQWCFYDFSDDVYSHTTTFIKEEHFKMGPPMRGRKYSPIAAVVGGYKICVFSTLIYNYALAEDEISDYWSRPNFEVLDTRHETWTELPELPSDYSKYKLDDIYINSYCVDRSCIIICTDIGIYGIDVNVENPKWVQMEGIERVGTCTFTGRWEMVGKNVCSPFEVARFGEKKSYHLGFIKKGPLRQKYGANLLCAEKVANGVSLCGVRGEVTPETGVPVLYVDVVNFDNKLLENMRGCMWNTIESDKSSIFEIESQACYHFELMGIFQFKDTDALKDKRRSEMEKDLAASKVKRRSALVNAMAVLGSVMVILLRVKQT